MKGRKRRRREGRKENRGQMSKKPFSREEEAEENGAWREEFRILVNR